MFYYMKIYSEMIYNNTTGLENNTLSVNINILHSTQVNKEIKGQYCHPFVFNMSEEKKLTST